MKHWLGNQWQTISAWYGRQIDRPRIFLVAILVATLGSVAILATLRINGDPIDLLPDNNPAVEAYRLQQDTLGATNLLRIMVDVKQPSLGPPIVDAMAAQLNALPGVVAVYAHPPRSFFLQHALLYLPYAELDAFASTVERRLHELTFADWITDLHVPELPLSIEPLLQQYPFARITPYYQTDDGLHYFIMLRLQQSPGASSIWTAELLATIKSIAADALATQPEAGSAHVRFAGNYFQVARQVRQITRDTLVVTAIALAGLALFFWVLHRNAWRVITLLLPLTLGTLWSYAAGAVFVDGINFFTVCTCMLTAGISSSMGMRMLYYFDHHEDVTQLSQQIRAATAEFFGVMRIPGVIFITALLFLSLTQLQALSQCGILSIISLLLHVISLYCCAPFTYRRLKAQPPSKIPATLQALTGRLTNWLTQTEGFLTITGIGITLMLALLLRVPSLNVDLTHLLFSPEPNHVSQSLKQIVEGITHPGVIHAASREDAHHYAAALRRRAQSETDPAFYTALSLDDVIPTEQEPKMARIALLREAFTPQVLEKLTDADRATYELLKTALSPATVTTETLPSDVRTIFQPATGALGTIAYIIPKVSAERTAELYRYTAMIESTPCDACVAPITISGETSMLYSAVSHIVPTQLKGMLGAAVTMLLIMLLVLRNRRHVLMCSVPPLATLVLTMSFLAWGNYELDVLNIGAMPLIMAFAVNATLSMQQEVHPTGEIPVTSYVRTASFLCCNAVAVIICFTATAFARNPGLSSFGRVAAFGSTIGVAAALLWFPGFVQCITRLFPLRAPDKIPSAISPQSTSGHPPPASDENSAPS